jgi:glycosyltransferase involved in cell wall biosynthesis
MKKVKVVIFIHVLQHYRIPIFNLVANDVDLTIVCNNKAAFENNTNINFSIVNVGIKKVGPFILHDTSIRKIISEFDVVVGLLNLRCLDLLLFSMYPFRKQKYLSWGIGVTASYDKHFDTKDISHYIRLVASVFSDALIFYSDYPLKYYKKIKNNKSLFVANNTIENKFYKDSSVSQKDTFLFVGSLYKEKGLSEMIHSYRVAYDIAGDALPNFLIVGEGDLKEELLFLIKQLNLCNKVKLIGAIYDPYELAAIFRKTLICVSPRQAGLSVLTSMSNAVPFVTTKNAITGGEIFNIKDGSNGLTLSHQDEMCNVFLDASLNKDKYFKMGLLARKFYEDSRQPHSMSRAISDAIIYTVRKK